LTHAELMAGGELVFSMAKMPVKSWPDVR